MDDLTAFERQVARRFQHHAGPVRPVDDAAIFAGITATRSPKWRFQTMFTAAKFAVAGATVALFGGFLLAGVLTSPSDEPLPAVGASASVEVEPIESPIASLGPTPAAAEEDEPRAVATRDDLLPGIRLELRQVAPGIYHVLTDGTHGLRQNVWDIAITPDGEAWVEKHRVVYGPKQYRDDRLRRSYRGARVLRLGEPGSMRLPPDGATPVRFYLDLDPQGDLHVRGTGSDGRVWRDGAWHEWERPPCFYALDVDRVCWEPNYDGAGIRQYDADRQYDPERPEQLITHEDLGLDPGAGFGRYPALGGDGTVWVDLYEGHPGDSDAEFIGLASYDGERWTTVQADEPVPGYAERVVVAPDGTVWVVVWDLEDPSTLIAVTWDGATWDTYGPVEVSPWSRDIRFAPDGAVWFDGTTFYDGSELRQITIPTTVTDGDLQVGPYSFGPDGSVWVVLIDMRDPESLGCEMDPDVCEGVAGLYVITPEVVATTE